MSKKKTDPRAGNIFGLEPSDTDQFARVCSGDVEKTQTAMLLFNSFRAPGTSANYANVIRDFREFCFEDELLSYEAFGPKEVAQFLVQAYQQKKGKAYISFIKPAISAIEAARRVPDHLSVFQDKAITRMIGGAVRLAAEAAPPTRKVDALPMAALKNGLLTHVWGKKVEDIHFVTFRTLYRWMIGAITLARFEGIHHIRSKHVQIVRASNGDRAVQIYLEKEKNDQLHQGQYRMLPEMPGEIIEPLTLTLKYFQRAGFTLGEGEDYICCRTQGKKADGRHQLTYTTALANGKSLVKQLGFDIRYGENSSRRLGVSNARKNDVSMDIIEEVGGWKTRGMAEHYLANSVDTKIKQAKALKFK